MYNVYGTRATTGVTYDTYYDMLNSLIEYVHKWYIMQYMVYSTGTWYGTQYGIVTSDTVCGTGRYIADGAVSYRVHDA